MWKQKKFNNQNIKKALLMILILFGFSMSINAQKKMKNMIFPESFKLGKQDFLKSQVFISEKNFVENGFPFRQNPGVVKDKEMMEMLLGDFDVEDIDQVYFEIYADKTSPDEENVGVVVAAFKSEEILKEAMQDIDENVFHRNPHLTTGKYLIFINGDDRSLIEKIAKFYTDHVDAKYYSPVSKP